jgi:hypothetical protein
MILILQTAVEKTQKVTEGIKNTEQSINASNIFQDIIKLLEVIIWPVAMIIALYMFKDHIGKIIKSLGSIKAGTSGFELNFIEDKLEEATKLIGIGPSGVISKEGVGIIPKEGGGIIPKSGTDITPKQSHAESPYQELIELQDAINVKLNHIASQNGITSNNPSNFALTNELANRNILNNHTAHKLKVLIELNTMGLNSPKITHNQVSQMKKLFNNISF